MQVPGGEWRGVKPFDTSEGSRGGTTMMVTPLDLRYRNGDAGGLDRVDPRWMEGHKTVLCTWGADGNHQHYVDTSECRWKRPGDDLLAAS